MIESFDIPKNDIARWAGIASAIYSLSQCLTAITWGRLSDRFGRKPIILICLINTMITSLLWGFSTSLPMALVARALSGAGNGNVGIIRTMVAEMCPWKELQPRAFSIMPLVYNVGSVLGPAIGGSLANPYRVDPDRPARGSLFERFPYAPPNIFGACFFAVGIVTGFLYIHETLESRKHNRDYGLVLGKRLMAAWKRISHGTGTSRKPRTRDEESTPLIKNDNLSTTSLDTEPTTSSKGKASKAIPAPTWNQVLTPQAQLNLLVYTLVAMHSMAYDQLLSVFMHHPYQPKQQPFANPFHFASGLGLPSPRIGLLFTLYGFANILFQILLFPSLARRLGVLRCMRLAACAFPAIYLLSPFSALMPTTLGRQALLMTLWLCKGLAGSFAFPCSTILLTNSAGSLAGLGTLNGVATSVSAVGRAAGPVLGGNLFTLGVKHRVVGVPFWVLGALAVVGAVPAFWLVEGDGFGDDGEEEVEGTKEDDGEDDDEDAKGGFDYHGTGYENARDGNERGEEEEEDDEGLGPLLSRQTTYSSYRYGSVASDAVLTDDGDDEDIESGDHRASSSGMPSAGISRQASTSRRPSRTRSQSQAPRVRRKSSVPVGLGTGFRRLSSNLGVSGSGWGTGSNLGG